MSGNYPHERGGLVPQGAGRPRAEEEPLPGNQAAEGWSVVCEVGPGAMKLGGGPEPGRDCRVCRWG